MKGFGDYILFPPLRSQNPLSSFMGYFFLFVDTVQYVTVATNGDIENNLRIFNLSLIRCR